jgi:hypothetical protein
MTLSLKFFSAEFVPKARFHRSDGVMKRRTLLSLATISTLMPASLVFAEITGQVDYSREVYENAIASGKPVLLDFSSKS